MLILVVVVLAGAWSTLALLPGTNYRTVVWTDPQHGQVERSYLLYIPASYSLVLPQQPPVPLLLNFHGWTSSGQNNMETESQASYQSTTIHTICTLDCKTEDPVARGRRTGAVTWLSCTVSPAGGGVRVRVGLGGRGAGLALRLAILEHRTGGRPVRGRVRPRQGLLGAVRVSLQVRLVALGYTEL